VKLCLVATSQCSHRPLGSNAVTRNERDRTDRQCKDEAKRQLIVRCLGVYQAPLRGSFGLLHKARSHSDRKRCSRQHMLVIGEQKPLPLTPAIHVEL
jgi:hypothetical protein